MKGKHPARSELIKDASVTQLPNALSHFYLISHFNNRRHIRMNSCSNDLGTNGVQAQFSYLLLPVYPSTTYVESLQNCLWWNVMFL